MRLVAPEMLAPGGPALNEMLLRWCAANLGGSGVFTRDAAAIAVVDGSEILSVAAFDNFRKAADGTPLNIECSVASVTPRWVTRGNLRGILSYPFCQLKVQRVTTFIAASNERSMKFTLGLGFKIEGRIRCALENGEDLFVTGMLREEAQRWLA